MTINKDQLRKEIIRPTLQYLELWSQAAEELLMGTAAVESQLGTYLSQYPAGPARGIFQMEGDTAVDIMDNFLKYRGALGKKVMEMGAGPIPPGCSALSGNLYYATAMARIHYLRVPEGLPKHDDLAGLASYWKSYYNTPHGKGTVEKFIELYDRYVTK